MPPILFLHGLWVTPRCFDGWRERATARGWDTHAPAWPHLDGAPADLRSRPPRQLARVGVPELVEHYRAAAAGLAEPPVLVGHSLGGLTAQLLLAAGVGRAAIALDPAPVRGVPVTPGMVAGSAPILLRPWTGLHVMSRQTFARDFANGLPADRVEQAYEDHVVPAPGRPFRHLAFGRHTAVRLDRRTAPLLLVAGTADRTVPASTVRATHRRHRRAGAAVDLLEAPGHSHWLVAEPGWEKVADRALDWLTDTLR